MNATALDAAAWAVAASSLTNSLLRLLLGVLAAQAARQALARTAGTEPTPRQRAHQLALLRTLLGSLHDQHEQAGKIDRRSRATAATDCSAVMNTVDGRQPRRTTFAAIDGQGRRGTRPSDVRPAGRGT
jgi:hypothetical protein